MTPATRTTVVKRYMETKPDAFIETLAECWVGEVRYSVTTDTLLNMLVLSPEYKVSRTPRPNEPMGVIVYRGGDKHQAMFLYHMMVAEAKEVQAAKQSSTT